MTQTFSRRNVAILKGGHFPLRTNHDSHHPDRFSPQPARRGSVQAQQGHASAEGHADRFLLHSPAVPARMPALAELRPL